METDTWSIKNLITGKIVAISKSIFKVGRNINADITSLTSSISRNHATFSILIDGLLYLQDNNSCNGTFINDQKIVPMELKLVNHGDIIGFGCCQQLCKEQQVETPLLFEVLKTPSKTMDDIITNQKVEISPVQTVVKNEFSSVSDCIIISDEEDDSDLFSNSQIYKITEKIKTENTINENIDPYYHIKQELEDLDYCEKNEYVVDLTEEENCFEKTSDLLDILESPIQTPTTLNAESSSLSTNQKCRIPQIIEPHFIKTVAKKVGSNSKVKKEVGNIKSTSKSKSSISYPYVKNKQKCKLQDSKYNKITANKSPADKNTCNSETRAAIIKERKRKLKEIASNNEKEHATKAKLAKNVAKVKNSVSRGTFLLEDCSSTPKKKNIDKESLPSTSKGAEIRSIQIKREDLKIQDTTVTSNFSPKNETRKPEDIIQSTSNVINDIQGPDSTVNENRLGLIWKIPSNQVTASVKDIYKNITIDDSIWKILNWSVKWLMEQNNIDRSPPVNGEVKPKEMPLNFNNFSEYILIISTLIMLELWQYVYQMLYNKDEVRSPIKIFVNHKRVVGKVSYLDCECYLSEIDVKRNAIPRMDDLVLIELKIKDLSKYYMYTGFAYIKCCKRKNLQRNFMIDADIATLCSGIPCINLTFTLMTKVHKEIVGKQVIVKVITNIGSSLKLLKGIKYLETSPICRNILLPKAEDFRISSHQNIVIKDNLNKEQKQIVLEAAELCLGNTPGLYLIKGPPGTGKSTVIVNIVLQVLFSSLKDDTKETPLILLTAPSNTAVDGLILKLADIRKTLSETQRRHMKLVRVGPESSISSNVDKFKLSVLARNHILKSHKLTNLEKYKHVIDNAGNVEEFLKDHFAHNYSYEMNCAEDILLSGSNIICTTLCSSVSPRILGARKRNKLKFSCCIIDEATQCTEPESLLPIQLGIEKFILVGDPQQLSAVVCNHEAQKLGYGKSLFARLDDNFKQNANNPIRMLRQQYRMKQEICEYPNKTFYNGKLKSAPLHRNRIVPELKPYLLFNLLSAENEDESLYKNSQEVMLICNLMMTLRKYIDIKCKYTIGIITPYRAQKEFLIRQMAGITFNENVSVTINTVDSFQGMENDVIIISCVRDTPNYFLQNQQRLNVALTRARQALYIIGNYSLFKHCQPLYDLREDAKKRRLCVDIKDISKTFDIQKYIFKT